MGSKLTNRPLRAAIVGAGQIARQHAACVARLEDVQLVAVCDTSPAKARCLAERFGISQHYTDYRAMLTEIAPDMVHVTTPPESHYPLAMAALEAGANVFVEKPLALTHREVRSLLDTAGSRDLFLLEDHNYRFNGPVQRALALCRDGALGKLNHVEIGFYLGLTAVDAAANGPAPRDSRFPGGVVFDYLPHMAYLALAFAGTPDQCETRWLAPPVGSPLRCQEFRAQLRCANTTVGLTFSAATRPHQFGIRLYGERGRVEIDLLESHYSTLGYRRGSPALATFRNGLAAARATLVSTIGGLWQRLADTPGPYSGMWRLIESSYTSLRCGSAAPVTPAEILATHELLAALLENAPGQGGND